MFLIAGISPKTRRIDKNPRRCPVCGLNQAFPTRIDYYFNLFFIPLFPVRRGQPFLLCEGCGQPPPEGRRPVERRCRFCGGELTPDFRFCPFCGKGVWDRSGKPPEG